MKIFEWIFRILLGLSILTGVIIIFMPGSNEGMAALGNAVGLGVVSAVGGVSLIVLVLIGIINYVKKSKSLDGQAKRSHVIKAVLLLIVFGVLAAFVVPMIIWSFGIFNPTHVTCTTVSGQVICR